MLPIHSSDATALSVGLLVTRVILGLAIAAHGAQKLFGWFGGHGLAATASSFEGLGFRPGGLFAAAASVAEFGGGLLTALGLFHPIGPAIIVAVMLVAMLSVHWGRGFFAASGGIELALLYLAPAIVLGVTGPGLLSLDALLGLTGLDNPRAGGIALVIGVIAAGAAMAMRRVSLARPAAAQR
jgi:putative oxidoreductase